MKSAARIFSTARNGLLPVAIWCVGCGGQPDSRSMADGIVVSAERTSARSAVPAGTASTCAAASEGCPCARNGETTRCLGPTIHTGNYTTCEPGSRACTEGKWGPCIGKRVYQSAGTLTQDYASPCEAGRAVHWGPVTLEGVAPGDSRIDLAVQTADTVAGLASAPRIPIGTFDGPANSTWTSADVDARLAAGGYPSASQLRLTLVLEPSSQNGSAPMVVDWRQAMTCVPAR